MCLAYLPDDNVLKVGFNDGQQFVVHRPPVSPFVRPCVYIFLKQLFFLNHWVIFETLQECSLHEVLLKLLKDLNLIKNTGYHGNQKVFENIF